MTTKPGRSTSTPSEPGISGIEYKEKTARPVVFFTGKDEKAQIGTQTKKLVVQTKH